VTDPALMQVPLDDHMVHRGHAVFDTASLVDGRIYRMEPHLDRLFFSASRARIKLPFSRERMREVIEQTCSASGQTTASVRLGNVQPGIENIQPDVENNRPGVGSIQLGLGDIQPGVRNIQPGLVLRSACRLSRCSQLQTVQTRRMISLHNSNRRGCTFARTLQPTIRYSFPHLLKRKHPQP
jgi:hypothetical protein